MKKNLLDKAKILKALNQECSDCSEHSAAIDKCTAIYYCANRDAAALIEAYAAQLAAVTTERDGLQAKYDSLNDFERTQSAKLLARLGTVEAERDAAVESWRGFCSKCEWRDKQYLADGKMDDRCKTCRDNHKCNWKWRGPQGAGEGEA